MKSLSILHVKYSRNLFMYFYIFASTALVMQNIYYWAGSDAIPFPWPLYAVATYCTSLLILIITILFIKYMVNSLLSRFDLEEYAIISKFKFCSNAILIIVLPLEIVFMVAAFYQRIHHWKGFGWLTAFFYLNLSAFFAVLALLMFVLVIYFKELSKFPLTFNDKKRVIFISIFVTVIQIAVRIANVFMIIFDEYTEIEDYSYKNHVPFAQGIYAIYDLLTYFIPIWAYTMYLRKDLSHIRIFNAETSSQEEAPNFAAIVEYNIREKSPEKISSPSRFSLLSEEINSGN